MLDVTGQRSKSHKVVAAEQIATVILKEDLDDRSNPINISHLSGKRAGSTVLASRDNNMAWYMATGSQPEDEWVPVGSGGGGGGYNPNAIVDIDGTTENSHIIIKREDGREKEVNLLATIQNTPAYDLTVQTEGSYNLPHAQMWKGQTCAGVCMERIGHKVSMPTHMYDLGGELRGGEWDPDTGDFYIGAHSVEVEVRASYCFGVHPDCPDWEKGCPPGDYVSRVHLERKMPDGSWEEIATKDTSHGSRVGWPNSDKPNFNTSGMGFTAKLQFAGWYRVRYSLVKFGYPDMPDVTKYVYLGCTAEDWYSSYTRTQYIQVKGTIKQTANTQPILPMPIP